MYVLLFSSEEEHEERCVLRMPRRFRLVPKEAIYNNAYSHLL